jgi:hypothetical protein
MEMLIKVQEAMLYVGQTGVRNPVGSKIVWIKSNWPKTHPAFYTGVLFLGGKEAGAWG